MTTVLAFIFVLGVLIFVHELGHFLVARLYGVRVIRFSLGFDPKIVKFNRGGTEYSIGMIPLGGFVKLGETAFAGGKYEECAMAIAIAGRGIAEVHLERPPPGVLLHTGRGGEVAGYGYVGGGSGPFALLDLADVAPALAFAETEAARAGRTRTTSTSGSTATCSRSGSLPPSLSPTS